MASRRPAHSNQQQHQGQEQQQSTNSSWFLNSSTGLYYYYNSQTDEFIYQNGTRVPRPDSIPRAGLLEQHREAGSNNNQQTPPADSLNRRNDWSNYTYAVGAQFEDTSLRGESLRLDPRAGRLHVQGSHEAADEYDEDADEDGEEEDSNGQEEDDEDDDDDDNDDSFEQQIYALTRRGYTRQEALRFLHLTSQQGYSREHAVIVIQYLRQGFTFAQAVMALQQSRQGCQERQRRQR